MSENVKLLEEKNDNSSKIIKRQRSTIGFPYVDYNSSSLIANAIHSNVGYGECSPEDISAWTSQSAKSSGFRSQLAAARLFGLIENGADSGNLKLSELGCQSIDPDKARIAKAKAFLCVPLFNALYEKYKDGVTPPQTALESEIKSLGVSQKQKAKARQMFERSAQQTGFRDAASNRLELPATIENYEENQEKPDHGGSGGEDDLSLDPLIMALLRKIPKTKDWPAENRLRWFRTFAMNISQVYDDDNNIVELEIDLISSATKEGENTF